MVRPTTVGCALATWLVACGRAPPEPAEVSLSPGRLVAAADADRAQVCEACENELVGTYRSTWGEATFSVDSDGLVVTYERGTMRCAATRSELRCRWTEGDTHGLAAFRRLGPNRLVGSWGHEGSATNGGPWSFVRKGAVARDGFSGAYSSTYGDAELSQIGARVTGTYASGELDCTASGRTLDCGWHEGDSVGRARFEQKEDGSLEGTWGHGASWDDGGPWTMSPRDP